MSLIFFFVGSPLYGRVVPFKGDDYTLGALGALVGLVHGRSIIAALAVTLSGVRHFHLLTHVFIF